MDFLLALSIFRAEFNANFFVMFLGLIYVKAFHWLVTKRSDFVRRYSVVVAADLT